MTFRHGANSRLTIKTSDDDPVDLTPYIKDFTIDVSPGAFRNAVPGLKDVTVTFSGSPSSVELFVAPAAADPLDEILTAAGIADTTPSHWQRIHRTMDFDAQQKATRARLAREWEPGDSEGDYT